MNIQALFEQIQKRHVLVIGDAMLDEYIEGEALRVSPEAPVLVMRDTQHHFHAGGAANVARNVTGLGGKAHLISICGADAQAHILKQLLDADAAQLSLLVDKTRPTTLKIRYLAQSRHLLRRDSESTAPLAPGLELSLMRAVGKAVKRADYMILSDYAKGVLNDSSLPKLIGLAKKHRVPMAIDPKKRDWSLFYGADLVTPNKAELTAAAGMVADSDAQIERAARKLIKRCGIKALLVTRSADGMSYVTPKQALHMPTEVRSVFDVAGAGDTVIAAFTLAHAAGAEIRDAMRFANMAAAVSVGKKGTAAVSPQEILHHVPPKAMRTPKDKIMTLPNLRKRLDDWRACGLTIGFTNGCFDILHHGHVDSLTQAASMCDRLVVGLNTDSSVRTLKGALRPVMPQNSRALVLAGLQAVDAVCVFREDTPLKLIEAVKPDILFKGADYQSKDIVGAKFVNKNGGEVKRIAMVEGVSTSEVIAKIQNKTPKR